MTVRNLKHLFAPDSVAVVGASPDAGSVGGAVLRNLTAGGFKGPILPVNPKYSEVAGLACYKDVKSLPQAVTLAIVCSPPPSVPGVIGELGAGGTKAAVVLTAGITDARRMWGRSLKTAMLAAARPHLLRVLGPSCLGLLVPEIGLNASFAHTDALPGHLSFVTQSSAIGTAVLDWAKRREIGFSKFVSMGDASDIDLGDVLDFLASDADTRAVLLFVETVKNARKFMSAARAASRNKPVVVLKAGRVPEGAKAASLHTGALAGSDSVYDAAFRRAGMLRVFTLQELFDAVETLARARPVAGERLAILTNGGGPGVMATDTLVLHEGKLAKLDADTLKQLANPGSQQIELGNPVDILGDATAGRYVDAARVLLADPGSDALLVLHAPNALVDSVEVAQAVAAEAAKSKRNVLACWLGGAQLDQVREHFAHAGVPSYDTPEKAVQAYQQIVQYGRNQALLMEAPPSVPERFTPDVSQARWIVRGALAHKRSLLTEPEAKSVLAAYGIPVVDTRLARSGEDAVRIAQEIGFPVAVKVCSYEVTHKSQVEGVALHLQTTEEIRGAIKAMRKRLRELRPDAKLRGFTVQRMELRHGAHELIIGAATDPVFGPVILFGEGGTAVEVTADGSVGLPPLNTVLARDLVGRTKVSRRLNGYLGQRPADLDAIYLALVQVSQMVTDIPEIAELDINPLLADERGIIALDARIRVESRTDGSGAWLAIRPYPKELEETVDWDGKRLTLRPIRPKDGPQHLEFFHALDREDVRMRMFVAIQTLPPSQLARLTQIDYDREMAFVATMVDEAGKQHTLGVVRGVSDPDNVEAEFAIVARSDLKGKGLGHILFAKLVGYFRSRGTLRLVGQTLNQNARLLALVKRFGCSTKPSGEPGVVALSLDLQSTP